MSDVKITSVRAIATAPQGSNLIIVRIDTNQPGLYGYGCATYTQRFTPVLTVINDYMGKLLIGHDALNVNDAWEHMMNSSYWRNGPVLNNAISGCDMALWDIIGKAANMPVWQLWGGKVRQAVPVYRHTASTDYKELDEQIQNFLDQGYQYIRIQAGNYGGNHIYLNTPEGSPDPKDVSYFDPLKYMREVPDMFEHVRSVFGNDVELLHDVHERLTPVNAAFLAKSIEQYRPFFLEDALAPEQGYGFKQLREASTTPLAMGELFNNPMEWMPLVENRWIDFIRCHISQIGGVTPARKLAAYCAPFDVRTAWHGPGDVSPIGHMANVHLDLTTVNFGIQEWCGMEEDPLVQDMFPGCARIKDGFAWANDKPGWGMEVDEELARKHPPVIHEYDLWKFRTPDGTSVKG
ncbi:MAG TPA: starvation-sensing protein RspA [Candidatus Faecaligallichristensenella faecipullorum]|nr:starvation-sensing protein RspA [Candidatus Faecaligallichristensenella faecipullorum]